MTSLTTTIKGSTVVGVVAVAGVVSVVGVVYVVAVVTVVCGVVVYVVGVVGVVGWCSICSLCSCCSIQLFRERLSEKMCTQQSRKVVWDMINTLFLTTVAIETNFAAFL